MGDDSLSLPAKLNLKEKNSDLLMGSLNESNSRIESEFGKPRTVFATMRSMNRGETENKNALRELERGFQSNCTSATAFSPSRLFERPSLRFSKSVDREVEAFSKRLMKSQTQSPDQKMKLTLPKGALDKMKILSIGNRRNPKEQGGIARILSEENGAERNSRGGEHGAVQARRRGSPV